ncbi:Uu.00g113820.m01.CDS01 [Anthostomella pinea]|uniref:Uu.00g113820.m01.CDS01 n=1 Tax=Anthostomella pinea TaxID=933095 RepID=A0AAI8YE62_9PEZI|nr:Uu.00g113820.m01.CDS01 [Anthostomella pinea]
MEDTSSKPATTEGSGNTAPATPTLRSQIPHPELTLPSPGLSYDFRMSVELNPKVAVGVVPSGGMRNWISFSGGSWAATWGSGTVLPGGQDSQLVDPETYVVSMETMYLLKTDDEEPAFIEIRTRGFRTGPREVLEALQDPEKANSVDPSTYQFRLYASMETGDERYVGKVNHGMWVGSGMRKGAEVIFDAYRIT